MILTRMRRIALLGVVLLSLSCAAPPPQPAPKEPPRPAESAEAQAIYAYLAYREYMQQHKTEEAAQAMEQAIALAPTPELYLELGNLYWRASRFSDALVVLKQGLDKYPESRLLLSTLAKTYAAQGRFDDAVLTLDDYRKAHPDEVDLVHETAIYRMEQRQFGDAVDRLTAIPKDKATTTTTFLMGKAFFGLGLTDKAIISFQQVVAAEPEYFDAWVELGLTYEAQKNYIDAERIFAQLVDSGVESQQIIFRLVDLNLKLNNPDKALSHVLDYQEDEALALEAANLFLTQGFYDHAAQLLDPLAQQNPVPLNALYYLSILEYEGRNEPDKALDYLESIPAGHPHHERSLVFRIHLLYQGGQKDEARKLCLSATTMFPRQPEFRIVLAEIYEREGNHQASLDVLLRAAAEWPQNMTILYRLGLLYDRMNDQDQAMVIMEKVIAQNPEHAEALNYLGYTLAELGRDLERAEILVKNALKAKPDNGYFIDSLAWVYLKQGRTRLAWQEIKQAVNFVDNDPIIWEHYGDIARALGFNGEALKGYTKALELKGENVEAVKIKINKLGLRR